jgi:hypothetical protein
MIVIMSSNCVQCALQLQTVVVLPPDKVPRMSKLLGAQVQQQSGTRAPDDEPPLASAASVAAAAASKSEKADVRVRTLPRAGSGVTDSPRSGKSSQVHPALPGASPRRSPRRDVVLAGQGRGSNVASVRGGGQNLVTVASGGGSARRPPGSRDTAAAAVVQERSSPRVVPSTGSSRLANELATAAAGATPGSAAAAAAAAVTATTGDAEAVTIGSRKTIAMSAADTAAAAATVSGPAADRATAAAAAVPRPLAVVSPELPALFLGEAKGSDASNEESDDVQLDDSRVGESRSRMAELLPTATIVATPVTVAASAMSSGRRSDLRQSVVEAALAVGVTSPELSSLRRSGVASLLGGHPDVVDTGPPGAASPPVVARGIFTLGGSAGDVRVVAIGETGDDVGRPRRSDAGVMLLSDPRAPESPVVDPLSGSSAAAVAAAAAGPRLSLQEIGADDGRLTRASSHASLPQRELAAGEGDRRGVGLVSPESTSPPQEAAAAMSADATGGGGARLHTEGTEDGSLVSRSVSQALTVPRAVDDDDSNASSDESASESAGTESSGGSVSSPGVSFVGGSTK